VNDAKSGLYGIVLKKSGKMAQYTLY